MKFTERQLEEFAAPLSQTEEERCKNALRMVRDAMKLIGYTDYGQDIYEFEGVSPAFALKMGYSTGNRDIFLLVQGSYANSTNVRTQSDVDMAVILESTFTYDIRPNIDISRYGISESYFTIQELKDDVERALRIRFNNDGVERKDKSIKVHGNSYRVDADVVPAYRYRDYRNDYLYDANSYIGGIEIRPDSGGKIINFPEQHIRNGVIKNKNTKYRFKRHVRILKKIKSIMEDYYSIPSSISSFGLESLLWNIPDIVYDKYSVLRFQFDELLKYLINHTSDFSQYKEANGIKPLFPDSLALDDYKKFVFMLRKFFEYDIYE